MGFCGSQLLQTNMQHNGDSDYRSDRADGGADADGLMMVMIVMMMAEMTVIMIVMMVMVIMVNTVQW